MLGRRNSLREAIDLFRDESRKRAAELRRWEETRAAEAKKREEESKRREEETREFNREILLRNEKVYTSMIRQLEENTEETRANTRAVLALLDRFDDPPDASVRRVGP